MTALHPSIDIRYKDGNVAQAALEEAWEQCISQELVGARAFSGKEVPHEKAPALMHATQTSETPEVPTVPANAAHPAAMTDTADDAPTRIMEGKAPSDGRPDSEDPAAMVAAVSMANAGLGINDLSELEAATALAAAEQAAARQLSQHYLAAESPRSGLWASVAFSAMLVCALAAYFVMNAL
jgi:hypothetical protein